MSLNVSQRLVEFLLPAALEPVVADVRIGLGYTAVRLASGQAGVAWTPASEGHGCTRFEAAGTLVGQTADRLLQFLAEGPSNLARAVGLATANALLATLPAPPVTQSDVLDNLGLVPGDRVVMVGYFQPLVARLKAIGCRLEIVELNPRTEGTLTPGQGQVALAQCSVAILTGTSLINGTCEGLLAALRQPRAAVLLGPSSPLCPYIFRDTPVTHVAGARVRNAEAVLRIVSQGGGTRVLKPHLDFLTARVDPEPSKAG